MEISYWDRSPILVETQITIHQNLGRASNNVVCIICLVGREISPLYRNLMIEEFELSEIRLPLSVSSNIQLWFFSDCSTTVTCNACPTDRQHHHSTRLQSPKWYIVTGLCPSGHAGRSGRRPTAFGRCPYRGSQVWHWVKFLKIRQNPPAPPCPPAIWRVLKG